jgi:hypothetical protein
MERIVQEVKWYHSNKYTADAACEQCAGVVRHEEWCITRNLTVGYEHSVVLEPETLTLEDHLILHALGAAWRKTNCDGKRAPGERSSR